MYDARMEMEGWSNASFDDSSWKPVQNNDEFKGNPKYKGLYKLSWQPMAPIRAIELMKPLSVTPIQLLSENTTVFIFKFAQNAAGYSVLQLANCPANTTITMYFSEVLCGGPNSCSSGVGLPGDGLPGTVDQRGLSPHQPLDPPSKRNQYICKGGGGMEVYEPRFTYIGHRYVEVTTTTVSCCQT
jgi:alpha-L-rhamnosidase